MVNPKIGVGSLVKEKVRKMEENTIIRRMRKEVVGGVQDMVGKKKFLVQFEDGQKRKIIYISLSYLCLKHEVGQDMDEPISDLPEK